MVYILENRDKTFADEWQLPDLVLQPTEVSAVKHAAEALGMQLTRTPTGRTCQMVLKAALDRCLYEVAMARTPGDKMRWQSAALRAKFALGQKSFN